MACPGRTPLRVTLPWLAAAAVLVLACGAALWSRPAASASSWPVVRLAGAPTAGSSRIGEAARLSVGEWLETDASSRATVAVSDIGRLDVDPGTRLRIAETREGTHRLTMAHGRVHALIWAPPGQFVVDTPSSRAVDLGCAYTLDVAPDGTGSLEVSAGGSPSNTAVARRSSRPAPAARPGPASGPARRT